MKNKLYTNGLKLLVLGVLALPLASTRCNSYTNTNDKPTLERITHESEEEYSLERFKKVLGDRYDESSMTKEDFKKFRGWEKSNLYERKFFCLIYEDPKKITNSFTAKEKTDYDRFNPYKIDKEQLQIYENEIPWRLIPKNNKFSESDRLMTFYMYINFFD